MTEISAWSYQDDKGDTLSMLGLGNCPSDSHRWTNPSLLLRLRPPNLRKARCVCLLFTVVQRTSTPAAGFFLRIAKTSLGHNRTQGFNGQGTNDRWKTSDVFLLWKRHFPLITAHVSLTSMLVLRPLREQSVHHHTSHASPLIYLFNLAIWRSKYNRPKEWLIQHYD